MKQPRQARALLNAQPQLAYAFLKGLLRLGMIDTATADQLVAEAGTQRPQHTAPGENSKAPSAQVKPGCGK